MGRVVIGRYLRGSVEVLALAMRPVRPCLRAGGSEFCRAVESDLVERVEDRG